MATSDDPVTALPSPADVRAHTVESLIRERLLSAVGGWRGSVEAALPTAAFVGAWILRQDVKVAVIASATILLVLLLIRLATRQTPRYVLSAVFATAIAAFVALNSGKAQDAFLPGMLLNAGSAALALLSVAVRWPIVGFMVAASDPQLAQDPTAWRRDRGLVKVCQRLTMVFVVLYAVLLMVMVPLYLSGQVTLLGIAKIALGWPGYVCALAVMGMMLVRGKTPLTTPEPRT